VLNASVLQGMAITVPLGVPVFVLFALFMGGFGAMQNWPLATWGWMSLAGFTDTTIQYRYSTCSGGYISR